MELGLLFSWSCSVAVRELFFRSVQTWFLTVDWAFTRSSIEEQMQLYKKDMYLFSKKIKGCLFASKHMLFF